MGDKLATRYECPSLMITDKEDEIIVIDDSGKREVNENWALVGKLIAKRQIKMGLVGEFMQKIWRPVGGMTAEEMPEDNTMTFRFSSPSERKRILNEGPFHFDKYLMVLKEVDAETPLFDIKLHECEFWVQIWNVPYSYLTKITAENLGRRLGRISKIDVDSEGNVKGNFIRIKVGIDVDKPLKRIIKSNMGGKEVTLNLKYEKLENFCYACGKMDHVLSECGSALQYGPWLRAQNYGREVKERNVGEVTVGNVDEVKECNVDQNDGARLRRFQWKRLRREQDEKEQKKKKKAGARLHVVIKVIRDEGLVQQIGRDVYFDLVDLEKVKSFLVQKQSSLFRFKDQVYKEFGVPAKFQRFWLLAKRDNHTYRPYRPLTRLEENKSVGQLVDIFHCRELKMFLEIERGLDSLPVTPPPNTTNDILLFFKLYDPWKEELSYAGRLFVKALDKPIDILIKLNELVGYAPDEEIELCEETRFEPVVRCDPIDTKISFQHNELQNGDIICFQKSLPAETRQQLRYPDVPTFLEYMHNA